MTCQGSVHKLNGILEEYRVKNYSEEFPKRVQKEVVKAAINSHQLSVQAVSAQGIEHVLENIGMGHRMSRSEIEGIINEVGTCPLGDDRESHCIISANQMLDLISKKWENNHNGLNRSRA
eukprot:CAMPEP_0172298868 /NCGR_PEP_ID=MMETSP1058-20130122/1324_1 /TAXON_ID=83371 /ORGANISM="Detonula confervacea, Strain CCMP 353" /LENGTH=119 /DNA_ID=CAMNT_0013008163 /DNA_START=262 /DNA_END=621 /DNA_ORIENTATION=-